MLFNSIAFALFLPLVFALYWSPLRRSLRAQNIVLITAGFVFYGWWDWRFLLLLLATSMTDYVVALAMAPAPKRSGVGARTAEAPGRRKALLAISLIGNLGTLGVFKYYDFFARSFAEAFGQVGITFSPFMLNVVLPVGISFYTFQALSYTIDVYRRRIEAVDDLPAFMAFISFFPQLCAGPIERASHMLPQFMRPRTFDSAMAADGMRQMLWGFFKKSVIADSCAPLVQEIFSNYAHSGPSTLLWGAFLFTFQIYCDFSGYTDVALGCARLFGFELMRNFAFPYFSRDIAEFWRRWHISLTTWFRDYLYIPLGGSRGSTLFQARNIIIIFLVSGFWHGANWTFLAWGLFNGLLFLPLLLTGNNRKHLGLVAEGRWFPTGREALGMVLTFGCTLVAWVFFRAPTITDALLYLKGMVSFGIFRPSHLFDPWIAGLIVVLLAVEWLRRDKQHGLQVGHLPAWVRRANYLGVFLLIFFFGRFAKTAFIYFQF